MARRRISFVLDNQTIEQLDALADRLGTTRTDLLQRGVQAVLRVAQEAEYDRQLVEAYTRTPPDGRVIEAALQIAAQSADSW